MTGTLDGILTVCNSSIFLSSFTKCVGISEPERKENRDFKLWSVRVLKFGMAPSAIQRFFATNNEVKH